MRIKILDVCEADMRKAEARFKDEVKVEDHDDGLFALTFKEGCTLSTHPFPVPQLFVYNNDANECIALFETDFSEVHII